MDSDFDRLPIIPHEHVARVQRRMKRSDLSHIVRVPGSCEHLQQDTGPGVKQGEQVEAGGLGKVIWAGAFIPTIPGTDTYTDQLR